jgi:hypothetical protein
MCGGMEGIVEDENRSEVLLRALEDELFGY